MLELMYTIPSQGDVSKNLCVINKEMVLNRKHPVSLKKAV